MKQCLICQKPMNSRNIKYCSTECAYKVINREKRFEQLEKQWKAKKNISPLCNCGGRIFWVSTMTMWGFILGIVFGAFIFNNLPN